MTDIESAFPNLRTENYQITSPKTRNYNCVAWAAGEASRWWWPADPRIYFWPPDIPREVTVEAFIRAFESRGYAICENGSVEANYEKIALFVDAAGTPTHMARQLESGHWTSKLGRLEDIRHDELAGVEGDSYGRVGYFLRKPKIVTSAASNL